MEWFYCTKKDNETIVILFVVINMRFVRVYLLLRGHGFTVFVCYLILVEYFARFSVVGGGK